jgi:hypothetical protein
MKIRRRTVVVIVAVTMFALLSPYILLFGTMAYQHAREYIHRERFESKAWKDPRQVESEDPVRLRMIDDLIRSKQLDHLHRADVQALLGEPSATDCFQDCDLRYWLGPERRWMSIDSEWLAIKLDQHGIVQSYRIAHD